jgi:DNA-binding NtrC family response regulator
VIERELFGYAPGALQGAGRDRPGLFEAADQGTLFLDEIAGVPVELRPKLLRAIAAGEFTPVGSCVARRADVRVLLATNAGSAGSGRCDGLGAELLRRLHTIEIRLPPLRSRPEDIPALAACFVDRHARIHGVSVSGLEPAALDALLAHAWPGNVRELGRVIECAVLSATTPRIRREDLSLRLNADRSPRLDDLSLADAQRILIRQALLRFNGRLTPAAKALGLSRSALLRLRDRYGLKSQRLPPNRTHHASAWTD